METRRRAFKKRRAEEDAQDELTAQMQISKCLNGSTSLDIGPRDITVDKDDQCSVNSEDNVIKQETKTELMEEEDEAAGGVEGGEFVEESIQMIKFETGEQKVVVVNDKEMICSDDDNNEIEGTNVGSCGEQGYSEDSEEESQLQDAGRGQDQTFDLKKLLPVIAYQLNLQDILLCRTISKKWRQIVDDFLHSKISADEPGFDYEKYLITMKEITPPSYEQLGKYSTITRAYDFHSSYKLKKFVKMMKEHRDLDLSPFVGHFAKKVVLNDANLDTKYLHILKRHGCSADFRKFIQWCGKYIVGLEIVQDSIACSNGYKKYFGQAIQMCLENCPNLKSFSILVGPVVDDDDDDDEPERGTLQMLQSQPVFQPSDDFLKPNVLSLPKNLKSFSMHNMFGSHDAAPKLPDLLMEKLIEPFFMEQLVKLELVWSEKLKLKMPHLKELTLSVGTCVHFEKLFSGKWLEAPIEKLTLEKDASTCPELSIVGVLIMLETFSTVRYLFLNYAINATQSFKNIAGFQANNIHTLDINAFYGDDKMPDDFLRAFPNLRYLDVIMYYRLDYRVVRSDPKLRRYVRLYRRKLVSVYESEIWEIAPDLEEVEITCRMHTCKNMLRCISSDSCKAENVTVDGTRKGYQQYCADKAKISSV